MKKTCAGCGDQKPETEFTKNKRTKDGLNCRCRRCTRAASARYQKENPERAKARSKTWYLENRERAAKKHRLWASRNREKMAAYCKAWRGRNPGAQSAADKSWYERNREAKLARDKARREENLLAFLKRERASYQKFSTNRSARNKRWRAENKDKICSYAAGRRSALIKRTPPWLSREDIDSMLKVFSRSAKLSKATGVPHHVDHIVPLRGRRVSGLNVPWNLQVLEASDNLKKSNNYGA